MYIYISVAIIAATRGDLLRMSGLQNKSAGAGLVCVAFTFKTTPALATCQPQCECPETIPPSPSVIHMSDEELGCPGNYPWEIIILLLDVGSIPLSSNGNSNMYNNT